MYQIDLSEVKSQVSDLIGLALTGEDIIITQNEQPILKVTRILNSGTYRKAGSAKGMIIMSDDFDEPLEDFQEYMR